MRKNIGEYPGNWPTIAILVKRAANWKCVRCGHPHNPTIGRTLTVHHLDMNPANNRWWNLVALCQVCHLHVQGKVILEREWLFEHSNWFKPYVMGYYAYRDGEPDDEETIMKLLEKEVKTDGT